MTADNFIALIGFKNCIAPQDAKLNSHASKTTIPLIVLAL